MSTLHRDTRRWLKSAKREEMDLRPLARLQNPSSQARYAGYMARFVCYFLRIIADEIAGGVRQFRRKSNTSIDNEHRLSEAFYNAESDMSDDETNGSDAGSNSDSDGRSTSHAVTVLSDCGFPSNAVAPKFAPHNRQGSAPHQADLR